MMELLAKLGEGMAEDTLLGGGGPRRFGITGAEAQAEIDKLIADKEFGDKLAAQGSGGGRALGPAQRGGGGRSRPRRGPQRRRLTAAKKCDPGPSAPAR
jgi:hypothetical protein